MIISISWRNVWRNKLRSSVILIAIALGIFAGVFAWAIYQGMVDQRIETAIETESSNIQIHNKGYIEDPSVKDYIENANIFENDLDSIAEIKGISKRIVSNAMAMSAEQGTGVKLMGVDPEKEKLVTNISQKVVDGAYFEGIKRKPIVIGKKLAEKLKLKVRSKIVVTLQQIDGTITRAQFRVVGIYDISNTMYEELNAFVRYDDLASILQISPDAAHEVAIKVIDNSTEIAVFDQIKNMFTEYEVKSWRELMPEVSIVEDTMDISMIFIMAIILFGLCLAIINTMLMAVLERIKEIGMLMAIGMNRKRVFLMILFETVFLAITGTIVGIITGSALSLLIGYTGLDLSSGAAAYESMGYDAIIYPVISPHIIVYVTIMVIIASLLSAIYPAIKALKLNPAEAIRTDV